MVEVQNIFEPNEIRTIKDIIDQDLTPRNAAIKGHGVVIIPFTFSEEATLITINDAITAGFMPRDQFENIQLMKVILEIGLEAVNNALSKPTGQQAN